MDTVTYTTAAIHLLTAVSELPYYVSRHRNLSGVSYGGRSGGGRGNGGGTQSRSGPYHEIFNTDR